MCKYSREYIASTRERTIIYVSVVEYEGETSIAVLKCMSAMSALMKEVTISFFLNTYNDDG